MSTSVDFSVTVSINGRTLNLNAGDLAKLKQQGLVFGLTHPQDMGNAVTFATWLNGKFGTSIDLATPPANLPDAFKTAYNGLMHGDVIVDTLVINQPAKYMKLGMSYALEGGAELIPGLGVKFEGIGLVVTVDKSA
jgi:hypothetical protein